MELPPWAKDVKDFVNKHREALESEHVSKNLNKWIDLIFGINQNSLEHKNIFHPLSYQDKVDWQQTSDPKQREVIEQQINEFGQTPRQIFDEPHPSR